MPGVPSFVLGAFERLFDIKPREFLRVHAFLLYLTTTSIFYTMGATVGDTLFLSRFGSERAEHLLPWVYIGTGLVTILLTWLYERAEERLPRQRFVVGVNLALAFSLLVFRWAVRTGHPWLFYALVIWLEACALVALMLFFSYAGDYFTSRDARRLYGYINGGVALGSVTGGLSVDVLVRMFGDENLLYVCSGLLACGALWCMLIPALAKPVEGDEDEEEEEDSSVPLKALLSDRFLQIVIVLVLASQACCWLVDYQLKVVASRAMQEEALAVFFGKFYSALGLVQTVVQFVLVGWLMRRLGVIKSLMILPALLCLSGAAFYMHPVLMTAVAGNFIRLTFLETLDEPGQELLFLPLPSRLRVRAQSFVEGMVLPAGISLAGVLLLVLSGRLHDVRQMSLVGVTLGLAWLAAIAALMPRYRDMLAASLRQLGFDSPDLAGTLAGAEGVKAVDGLLRADDPDRQVLGLDLWQGRALGPLAEPVSRLVDSPNEQVAVKAVRALAADKSAGVPPALGRALADARPEVRAAAITAHFEADSAVVRAHLPRWLGDGEPSVRVAVLTGCLTSGDRASAAVAMARLAELIQSAEVAERVVAAKVLAGAAGQGTTALFKRLLTDPDVAVRREVVQACAAAPEAGMTGWLVEQLREPALRPLAAQALEGMPLSAVSPLIELIAERERSLQDRALLLRVLGRFGGLRGAKVLWEVLESDEDVTLRVACAETLLSMQSGRKALDLARLADDGFLARRTEELAVINEARAQAGGVDPFFSQALFDHARLEVRAMLFTLAATHGERRAEDLEASLFEGSEAQKANALEMIEVVFPREKAAPVAAAVAALVAEPHADGGGLGAATIARLMRMPDWVRAATRHHLAARGHVLDQGGEKMSGQERYMVKLMSTVSFLKRVRLFEGVSATYLMGLAKIMQERTFCKDEVLFAEGRQADACYLVCEGSLRVSAGGRVVARLGPRESVGEMALISKDPYAATVAADEQARVFRVPAEEFDNLLLTHPEITVALLRQMTARLRDAQARAATEAAEPRG